MRQRDRPRAQGHQKQTKGHPGDDGLGRRGKGGWGWAGGRLVAKGTVEAQEEGPRETQGSEDKQPGGSRHKG